MKISRIEKQKENIQLEKFVSFAPDVLASARPCCGLGLSDVQRLAFAHVHAFLNRELQNRTTKGRHKKADEEKISAVIRRFNNDDLALADALASLSISRATFYRYLAVENRNRADGDSIASERSDKINIFLKLSEGFAGKISASDLQQLKDGLQMVEDYIKATAVRRQNLRAGRKALEEQIETDSDTRDRIKKVRARNALTAVRTRPKDAASRGGETGGRARAKKLTKQERELIARSAAESRWVDAKGDGSRLDGTAIGKPKPKPETKKDLDLLVGKKSG